MIKKLAFAGLAHLGTAAYLNAEHYGLTQDQMENYLNYLAKFGKTYNSVVDFEERALRFAENHDSIERWNSNPKKTHSLGHNQFSDWFKHEYDALLTHKTTKSDPVDPSAKFARKVMANQV